MEALLPEWLDPRLSYAAIAIITYTTLCHALRFRRLNGMKKKYGFGPNKPLSEMTDEEAQEIQIELGEAEFPALFEKGLQLALFRTYGIPSISKLLVQTAQLSTNENVAKRYADTAVIIREIYGNVPTGERSIEAFARLNYLHGHYIKQGRITNDDMLYTLALFMNHPREWVDRYEWRKLTDMEVCALATFHKSMGDAMKISYDVLPGSKTGWKDGVQFYDELDAWAKQYELEVMLPHKDNYDTAIKTKELLLSTVPSFTHGAISQLIPAAMDERLQKAIMFEPAHPFVRTSLDVFFKVRRFFLRHFALPRPDWQRMKGMSKEASADGRRWILLWETTPHYVKPTFWGRWGPSGIYQLLLGAPRPGDPGMCPEGYLRSNVGPRAFNNQGAKDFESETARLKEARLGGCPFVTLR